MAARAAPRPVGREAVGAFGGGPCPPLVPAKAVAIAGRMEHRRLASDVYFCMARLRRSTWCSRPRGKGANLPLASRFARAGLSARDRLRGSPLQRTPAITKARCPRAQDPLPSEGAPGLPGIVRAAPPPEDDAPRTPPASPRTIPVIIRAHPWASGDGSMGGEPVEGDRWEETIQVAGIMSRLGSCGPGTCPAGTTAEAPKICFS